jgi:hypothetical protein
LTLQAATSPWRSRIGPVRNRRQRPQKHCENNLMERMSAP